MAAAVQPTLGEHELVERRPMGVMDFLTYGTYASKFADKFGGGFVKEPPGAVGYGFNCSVPEADGNRAWVLMLDEDVPVLGVDADMDGSIGKRERIPMKPDGQGFSATRTVKRLPWRWRAHQSERGWEVACENRHVRTGTVELAGAVRPVSVLAYENGDPSEGLLTVDMNGDGRLSTEALANEEVRIREGRAQFQVMDRRIALTVTNGRLEFTDQGPARTALARLVVGQSVPALADRFSDGGVLVFVAPACHGCERIAPDLAAFDGNLVAFFNGSDEAARTWSTNHHEAPVIGGEEGLSMFERFSIRSFPCAARFEPGGVVAEVAVGATEVSGFLGR